MTTTPTPVPNRAAIPDSGAALRGQCLASGLAGYALLPIEQARTGTGTWRDAHTALAGATRHRIVATSAASLYLGAPAVTFAVHLANGGTGRYAQPLTALRARTAAITRQRLQEANARIDTAQRPRTSEYDLFYGLTGLGALYLAHDPGNPLLEQILAYLTRLTVPLPGDDRQLPGWWTSHDPHGRLSSTFPSGRMNLGAAHGIAGPLTLMSAAARYGITVTGLHDAITRICAVLDNWRQDGPAGPWWPGWITLPEHVTGRLTQAGPGRPSWCYGTPGLAGAQLLAGRALGDTSRQDLAIEALRQCLADRTQLRQIRDATLCHGTAGILLTTHHAARDATPGTFTNILRHLRAMHDSQPRLPDSGLLEGSTGRVLASLCDDAAGRTASGWEACMLLAPDPQGPCP
jgi:hypothetical protein